MKHSILSVSLILILLTGCQRYGITTSPYPKPSAIPTATDTRLVNGHVYPIFQDRCPEELEASLAEMGITPFDKLVIYDGAVNYNQDGISIYSLLDDSITHIDGTELPAEWDEQLFIPGPGEDSVTMIRRNWDQDISKLWIIPIKTVQILEILSEKAAYRHFKWVSKDEILVTGIIDEATEGAKFWHYYPIALVNINKNSRYEYPRLTDYTGYFETNIKTIFIGEKLVDIYFNDFPGDGQLYLFDYENRQITPILPWITDQAEFSDSGFLLTHLGIQYNPTSESYDIVIMRGADGFDFAKGLSYSDLAEEYKYDALMQQVIMRHQGDTIFYPVLPIGNDLFVGTYQGEEHIKFLYDYIKNITYLYCKSASMIGYDVLSPGGTYMLTYRFESPVMQVEPDESIILDLKTGNYTNIKPFNVLTWVSIE